MRLYSLTGQISVTHPVHGTFGPAPDGGFDLPGPVFTQLHRACVGGQKQWETSIERQHRLIAEEAARRADPRTLLDAVEQLVKAAERSGAQDAAGPDPKPHRRTAKVAEAPEPDEAAQ